MPGVGKKREGIGVQAAGQFDQGEATRQCKGPEQAARILRAAVTASVPVMRMAVPVTVTIVPMTRVAVSAVGVAGVFTAALHGPSIRKAAVFGNFVVRRRVSHPMTPEVSVVVPACNEAGNVAPLAREIAAVLRGRCAFEMIFVDDGSTDGTAEELLSARAAGLEELRVLRHSVRSGQSAAVRSGVRAARGAWIATLDGDGQNDPADLPSLLAARARYPDALLIMGQRTRRRDTWLRKVSSRIANGVRRWMLQDGTPDTGCGIKVFQREAFLELPAFDHMHRFLPALFRRAGSNVVSIAVNHRPRTLGLSKYGVHNRLWVGIVDLFGVRWLNARARLHLTVSEE